MKSDNSYSLCALAVAVAFIGALALDLAVSSTFFLAIAAACPLMMFLMMRGMHGGRPENDTDPADWLPRDHHHPHGSGQW